MTSSLRWRLVAAVFVSLFAGWSVLPNFIDIPKDKWYSKFVPDSKIQMGLDLQGGVQLTLGVDLERAVLNEADRYVRDLEEWLKKESIPSKSIERTYGQTSLTVVLENESDMDRFEDFIRKDFNVLVINDSNAKERSFSLDILEERKSEIRQQTIGQALETLRNRLDEFGVAEPTIQAKGSDKISIQLPGLADPTRAREILAQTAQLEFLLVDDQSVRPMDLQKIVDEAKKSLGENPSIEELNFRMKEKLPSGTEVRFEVETDPTTGETFQLPYLLVRSERISGDLLEDARVGAGQFGEPVVNVQFNSEGTKIFDQLTKKSVGKKLAIVLDGVVKSAPVLQSHISNGNAQITLGGGYRPRNEVFKEATDLALVLRAGALPAPIEILGSQAVGPSLGKDSIEMGLNAMKWGALLIVLFMAFYYRMSGVVADLALVINIVFVLACLGLLHATLTLPGLAGILISIGISADANIIIFERIREELKSGKTVKTAVETAYERANLTIIDSNLTTIITGVVLFEFGTGAIKGFAITLIFGLIANYITALWFTKIYYDWLIQKFEPKTLSV